MSVLSDVIAQHIDRQLEQSDGVLELCRSELAHNFGCTPSQITYVLRTRFSAVRGYLTESRRGGGGYVRICRVDADHAKSVSDGLRAMLAAPMSRAQAQEAVQGLIRMGVIEEATGRLMLAAVSDEALREVDAGQTAVVRAQILSQMLLSSLCGQDGDGRPAHRKQAERG